jgi:hypothetical protein
MRAAIVRWVLASVFPSTDRLPGLDRLDTRAALAEIFTAPALMRWGLYGSVLVFLLCPVLTIGWPLPAPLLPRRARDRHAYAMATSRLYLLRQAMLMLKTVGGLLWGAHPEVRARLGLAPYDADPGTFRTSDGTATARRSAR